MQTETYTSTYTVADIRRVLDNFAADFAMIAQATGLRSRENVDDVVADLKSMADSGYLAEIHITLYDAAKLEMKAAKYAVSTRAEGWLTQLPANNLWPRTPGGELAIGVLHTKKFTSLDQSFRSAFLQRLRRAWGPTNMDFNHSQLVGAFDRRYASNGWGMEKHLYQ